MYVYVFEFETGCLVLSEEGEEGEEKGESAQEK